MNIDLIAESILKDFGFEDNWDACDIIEAVKAAYKAGYDDGIDHQRLKQLEVPL